MALNLKGAEQLVQQINNNPDSKIVYLPLTRQELHSLLTALAEANFSNRTESKNRQINTWVAGRILRIVEGRS